MKAKESKMMFRRNKSLTFLAVCMVAALFVSIQPDSAYVQATQPPIKIAAISPDQAKEVTAALEATATADVSDAIAQAFSQIPAIDYFSLSENARQQNALAERSSLTIFSDDTSTVERLQLRSVGFEDGHMASLSFFAGEDIFSVDDEGKVILNIESLELLGNKVALIFGRTPQDVSKSPRHAQLSISNSMNVESESEQYPDKMSKDDARAAITEALEVRGFKLTGETIPVIDEEKSESSELILDDRQAPTSDEDIIAAMKAALEARGFDAAILPTIGGQDAKRILTSQHLLFRSPLITSSAILSIDLAIGNDQPLYSLGESGELVFHGLESIIVTEERIVVILNRRFSPDGSTEEKNQPDQQLPLTATFPCQVFSSPTSDGGVIVFCFGTCPGGKVCTPGLEILQIPFGTTPIIVQVIVVTCRCV